MTKVQFLVTPAGEELAVLSRVDFERLIEDAEMLEDIAALDEAKRELAAGEDELIPSEIVDRLLDGDNKVKVWREFRELSAAETAALACIDEARLAGVESGAGEIDMQALEALAPVLRVDVEDLLPRTK